MYAAAIKSKKENISRTDANEVAQGKSGEKQGQGFVNNRMRPPISQLRAIGYSGVTQAVQKKTRDKDVAKFSGQTVVQRVVDLEDGTRLTTLSDVQDILGRPLPPYGEEGMSRHVIEQWVAATGTPIEFNTIHDLMDAATRVVQNLQEERQTISDDEIAKKYRMYPDMHPRTNEPVGYAAVPVHETRPQFHDWTEQEYFYRAMSRNEALTWLYHPGNLAPNTGQPWASYMGYSMYYLNEQNPYLLEVHAPGWLDKARSIGIISGKPESLAEGDMSFGTGAKSETSTGFSKETNRAIKSQAEEMALAPTNEGSKKKVRRDPRQEALMLSSLYFRNSIRRVRPVRIKGVL